MSIEEALAVLKKSPIQRQMDSLPVTLAEISQTYGVPLDTVTQMNEGTASVSIPMVKNKGGRPKNSDYDSIAYLRKSTKEIDDALIREAKKGKVTAIEHFNRLLGRDIQRTEVNIGLSPTELYRRNLGAADGLRELGYRIAGGTGQNLEDVEAEFTLLPDAERKHPDKGKTSKKD